MSEELAPWQEDILRRIIDGEKVSAMAPRMHGKHNAMVEFGASLEAGCEPWDVVGGGEAARRLRRESRERAADRESARD